MSDAQPLEELSSIPPQMAARIQPLFLEPTVARYKRYLNAMYHYTRYSGNELEHAAQLAPTRAMRDLFGHMARSEQNHYRLAERDMLALGESIDPVPPASVVAYRNFWNQAVDVYPLLGALYVLENVAGNVGEAALGVFGEVGLTAEQTRFVAVHVQEDDAHGQLLSSACGEVEPSHQAALTEGARRGADHWVAIHLAILGPT